MKVTRVMGVSILWAPSWGENRQSDRRTCRNFKLHMNGTLDNMTCESGNALWALGGWLERLVRRALHSFVRGGGESPSFVLALTAWLEASTADCEGANVGRY